MRPKKQLDIADIIGKNIKRIRVAKGMKVKELAETVGIAVQSWYKWERGKVVPEDRHQLKIADGLGVTVSEIRAGIEAMAALPGVLSPVRNSDDGTGAAAPASAAARHIPVFGLGVCNAPGWFIPKRLAVNTPFPFEYNNQDRLFAVLATGNSMEPDGIREGFLLYCDTAFPADPGDAVFVQNRDGTAAVKRFVKLDKGRLVLQDWRLQNGEPVVNQYSLSLDVVESIANVVLVRRKA